MAGTATLTFAGDASGAQRASRETSAAVEAVGTSATSAADDMQGAQQQTNNLAGRLGSLGAATSGATDAIDSLAGGMQALVDIQNYTRERAQRLARAQNDVEQAMADGRQAAIDLEQSIVDVNQAMIDGTQASLDFDQAQLDQQQAMLDVATAEKELAKVNKEYGKGSDESKQAVLDLKQAWQDAEQAGADLDQATQDAAQSQVDLKQYTEDGKQASIDARGAQLDLADAMTEANPSGLQEWSEKLQLVTPLLSAVVGVLGLVTAAQWLWNSALFASPITWIVLGIIAVIAVIALVATKTDWFQRAWSAAWGGIKSAASAVGRWFRDTLWGEWIQGAWNKIKDKGVQVWNWMKDLPNKLKGAFRSAGEFISAPFKSGFNAVSRAWNNTIGQLSWTVPGWVPGVGGNSISAPRLPYFHSGVGAVPGTPGSDVVAVLQAGETVLPASSSIGGGNTGFIPIRGDAALDALIQAIAARVDQRGGRGIQLGIRIVT